MSRKIAHHFDRWAIEAYIDWSCWLVGVNWYLTAYYLHVGPLIVGLYKWRYEDQPPGLMDVLSTEPLARPRGDQETP